MSFKPLHQTEAVFSIRRCMAFTEAMAREASALGITPTDLLFSFTQMLVNLCTVKGYDWDKIVKAMDDFYKERQGRQRIILP